MDTVTLATALPAAAPKLGQPELVAPCLFLCSHWGQLTNTRPPPESVPLRRKSDLEAGAQRSFRADVCLPTDQLPSLPLRGAEKWLSLPLTSCLRWNTERGVNSSIFQAAPLSAMLPPHTVPRDEVTLEWTLNQLPVLLLQTITSLRLGSVSLTSQTHAC